MKSKRNLINFLVTGGLGVLFAVFTILVKFVDVQNVAQDGSAVGLAKLNVAVMDGIGYNLTLYKVTEGLGYAAIAIAVGFAIFAIVQLFRRKNFKDVDKDIYALLVLYVIIVLFYGLFELLKINYRPILIDGESEASYPSTHTLIAICLTVTAMMQFKWRTKDKTLLWITYILCSGLCAAIVIGRFLSGVHWFSDILGGIILSAFLVMAYYSVVTLMKTISENKKESN